MLVLVAFAVSAGALWLGRQRTVETTRSAIACSRVLWLIVATSALQLVPLPPSLLRVLSPRASDIWGSLDAVLGTVGRYRPVTLDLHATAFQLVTSAAVAVLFDMCVFFLTSSRRRDDLIRGLVTATLAFELVSLAHPILGLRDRVYGLLQPRTPEGHRNKLVLSPLLNENHAAAVGGVATALLVGLALAEKNRERRLIYVATAALSLAFTLILMSRGGMVIVMLEVVVLTIYAVARGWRRSAYAAGALALVPVVVGAFVAAMAASPQLSAEIANRDTSKLVILASSLPMIREFPLTGVGRGAFVSSFGMWEPPASNGRRYTHPETWLAQLPLDLGLPLAAIVIVVLMAAVLVQLRAVWQRGMVVAAFVALAGLVIHDLADFALCFAGVQFLAAALLAIVVTASNQRDAVLRSLRLRALAPVLIIPMTLGVHFRHSVEDDCDDIAASWKEGALAAKRATVIAALERHPADPYLTMAAGVTEQGAAAGAMLARAVKLAPLRASGHFWLARWFVAADRRSQGWAEYRESVRLAPESIELVLRDVVDARARVTEVAAIADSEAALSVAVRFFDAHQLDAEPLDDILIERYPPAVSARVRKSDRALARGQRAIAETLAREIVALAPANPAGHLALARSLTDAEAVRTLEVALAIAGENSELLRALAIRRATANGLDSALPDLARLRIALEHEQQPLELYHATAGHLQLAAGHAHAALRHYVDAAAIAQNPDAYLEEIAAAAVDARDYPRAIDALRRLVTLKPGSARHQSELARVQALAAQASASAPAWLPNP
ncbi:MAG: O-antigen ligase family protein [Deltaproteobacteria bacterium]|nr:O-antigen ligase family protein [Deltaproteobacteria bacterium]